MKKEIDWQNQNEKGGVRMSVLPKLKDKGIHRYPNVHSKDIETPFLRYRIPKNDKGKTPL